MKDSNQMPRTQTSGTKQDQQMGYYIYVPYFAKRNKSDIQGLLYKGPNLLSTDQLLLSSNRKKRILSLN